MSLPLTPAGSDASDASGPPTLRIALPRDGALGGVRRGLRTEPEPLPPARGSRIRVEKRSDGAITFTIPFRKRPGTVTTLALSGLTSHALAAIFFREEVDPMWTMVMAVLGLFSFAGAAAARFGTTRISIEEGFIGIKAHPLGLGRSWRLRCCEVRCLTREAREASRLQLIPFSGPARCLGPALPTSGEAEWLAGELWKSIRGGS